MTSNVFAILWIVFFLLQEGKRNRILIRLSMAPSNQNGENLSRAPSSLAFQSLQRPQGGPKRILHPNYPIESLQVRGATSPWPSILLRQSAS